MSSSVLRNVIQPKHSPSPNARTGSEEFGEADRPVEEMEQVLGVLIENAPVAMAMFDHQMRYVLANRSWVEEFSLQGVHPLIGRSQYEVFPGMHPGWRQVYDRALQGHVVRSEHDALSGPDGRRVVYRWEVRPWRRKKDASVGGLMVTCEKFGNAAAIQALTPEEPAAGPAPAPEPKDRRGDLAKTPLPMLRLDEKGIIHQTNAAAMELGLARGIQEGFSTLWEVFADTRESARIPGLWAATLDKLARDSQATGSVLEIPALQAMVFTDAQRLPPQRWLITPCQEAEGPEGEEGSHYLALLLPAQALPEPRPLPAAAPAPAPTTPPNLPAIAQAVAALAQHAPAPLAPAAPAEPPGMMLELRRVQDELARARQELRTLHEAERVFTQKESRVLHYLDALPCGVLVLDDLGSPVYQNEPLMKLLGRPVAREETVEDWLGAACPTEEHLNEVTTLWREDVWRRQLTRTFSLATADGLLKELEFQPSGLPGGGLLICIQDATEHCRHEEQLRATEAKFRTLLHENPVPVVLMDKAGAVFEVNHLAESLLGQPKTELRRYALDAWLEGDSATARREALQQMLETGERSLTVDIHLRQPGGHLLPASLTIAPVLDAQGDPHCTIHFLQKKVAALTAAAASVHAPAAPAHHAWASAPEVQPTQAASLFTPSATPSAPAAPRPPEEHLLLRTNVNGRIKFITPHGLTLLGLTEAEARGRSLHLHFRPSDPTGFYAQLTDLAQSADPVDMPCFTREGERQPTRLRITATDGGGFDFELTQIVEAPEPEPTPVDALSAPGSTLRNALTSAPHAAWPVADLSREKLLLSETHHRIKNHLQIISSLLNLESNSLTDTTARSALRSSQNRVRAIAELHQHLYQLAIGTGESFQVFAEGLVQRLRDCYQVPVARVTVQLSLQPGHIEPEWLMPLALTLNETLSNSFEHAFPEGRSGSLQVRLTFSPQGGQLLVRDDGIGLRDDFDTAASTGLGLKILGVFAEQMNGSLQLTRLSPNGTQVQLNFPLAPAPSA